MAENGTVDTSKFTAPLNIPNGKTEKIYTTQPEGDTSRIGVYDSGKVSKTDGSYVSNITNMDYTGVVNPYTYNMTGNRVSAATNKAFSSTEFIYYWDKTKTENLAQTNKWSRYDMTLSVDSVSYPDEKGEPITTSNNSSIKYPTIVSFPGQGWSMPTIDVPDPTSKNPVFNGEGYRHADPGAAQASIENTGNAQLQQGQSVALRAYASTSAVSQVKGSEHILMWDPTGFEYDLKKKTEVGTWSTINKSTIIKYGVAKDYTKTAPYTMRVQQIDKEKLLYTWYDSPEVASSKGDGISAIIVTRSYDHQPSDYANITDGFLAPATVKANPGSQTPRKKPLVLLHASKHVDSTNKVVFQYPYDASKSSWYNPKTGFYTDANGYGTYAPTKFESNGTPIEVSPGKLAMDYYNYIGESAFVNPFAITTKTEVAKSLYESNEKIDIKVTGVMTGSDSVTYDGVLTTTLPKGISYYYDKKEPPTDASGNPLPQPDVTTDSNGLTTLRWEFPKLSNDQRKKGIEVNFKATSDFTQLTFKDSGYTKSLVVKTVGEMWVNGNPSLSDTSVEGVRSSQDDFIILLIQQIILSKKADKPSIEVGDIDPVGVDNRLTYTVKLVNNSAGPLPNVKLLDVLPYDGDSRGTKFKGTYTVESVEVNDPSSTISYTTTSVDEHMDPNDVTGWTDYTAGSASKNAKGILVSTPSLAVGQTVELTITLKPTNQKAGDVLVNDAGMNSDLHLPVNSQAVWTRVYGRDLSGVVWYDDNYDGLIGNMANGSPELFAKNIPVKLYLSSLSDTAYKDQLVEASLTGEKFVDASGNSLVQTDTNGFYKFSNLPEGTYVAEFIVGEKVVKKEVQITTPEVGDDPTKNSKASQETYKTPGYLQPLLADLPGKTTPTNPTYSITDVNLGLIRSSTIRLFKYASGTAVDANKDGVLSDIEKATGTPLVGAEFTIYQEGKALGTAVTDSKGFLTIDFFFRGTYTLIETKAPDGYELVKHPIEVEISEGNETILLYQEDDRITKLPYAGGNGPVQLFLMISGGLLLVGFGGVWWHFRLSNKKGRVG